LKAVIIAHRMISAAKYSS